CGSYLTKFSAPLIEDIAALRSRNIVNRVRSEAGVEPSYMAAWRSLTANKKSNPGSIFSFETDAENRFSRAFLCLRPWGEEKFVPIAFTIASVENSDNWIWFCENLYKALPLMNSNES
ncbi:2027_t:CDS:2, partial [Dentiscutata erythropus]